MAQSFLNMPGLPLGLRNNNPGNLRPLSGGVKWLGEIEPDTVNNFSRFLNVGYGLRAMITDITGDIVNDGRDTLRKLITAYAPPGENNTTAYISNVSTYTGLAPDQKIPVSRYYIEKIIRGKMNVELGSQYAARISQGDINEGFDTLSAQVKAWLNLPGNSGQGNIGGLLIAAALVLGYKYRRRLGFE